MNIPAEVSTLQIFPQRRFKVYQQRQLDKIELVNRLPEALKFEMKVVASVLPFRVNEYVANDLIDWDNLPADPIFQLSFPQKGMLAPEAFERMATLLRQNPSPQQVFELGQTLRAEMNPHPAGQMSMNVPELDGEKLPGMQHKYKETALFFPAQGQYCHSYCTFCFRWAQFVGKAMRFNSNDADTLHRYLAAHPEISDLLITGGDPMVMKTTKIAQYVEPLIDNPDTEHVQTVRFGTKALTFWPYRFVTDDDADELLALFRRLVKAGKHVSIMAHLNHWQEMETPIFEEAVRRIRATGANIRAQAPLLKNINDNADDWAKMWQKQVKLGIIPYYMFVERDTGPKRYFEVPLYQAYEIYRDAISKVSGLARTARGPSMSAGPGKVEIQGVTEVAGEKVFVLRFIQARNPDWAQRPFFAKYDENAHWLDDLKPAFGEAKFFWQEEYEAMGGSLEG
ncbi:KamA family radical SAM protein [Ferrimonas balearica]|uniref:KamA family radical SAM protein n=1 Tax=Ferrimonas balearica TaxID=44012 RepID=UPI001C55FBE1|nr:lysine 2,3-aminomutase [Ferrimonas balearica]MBW3138505.1 lysine 2,3-aminomutase [Ferrimonas balearica]MBW3163902.1 lysine 2,3-aminomutase [Ferrimonas balearica]